MPRIPDYVADCSIFLYPSVDEAKAGTHFGGSGFLVHVPSTTVSGQGHVYAVTNNHLIDNRCRVIRLSRRAGGIDTIETEFGDWIPHPGGDDVAVYPIRFAMDVTFRWWSIGTDAFIDRSAISAHNIGYGDEVFLVGRLVTHSGQQRNAVVIRFGNVSLMADEYELIECGNRKQEGFLVECRSLSGFSGSAVFVMTTQAYCGDQVLKLIDWRASTNRGPRVGEAVSYSGTFGPWLLGINWGHVTLWTNVYQKDLATPTGFRTESNTGIACVLPAWKILEALNRKDLVADRQEADRQEEDKAVAARVQEPQQ